MLKKTLQTLALLACCQLAFAAPGQAAPATDTPAAAVQPDEDAWVARLTAWADEFQIPEKDLPRNKKALRNLRKLDLDRVPSDNRNLPKITRLPPEIGQLQQLQQLALKNNQLTTLPAEIGNLQKLRFLWIGNNQLATLPAEMGNLQELQNLLLENNKLKALPAEIGNLQHVRELRLHANQLTALPATIGQLQQLQDLTLDNNELTALPSTIIHLHNLKGLTIRGNRKLQLTPEQEQYLQGVSVYR